MNKIESFTLDHNKVVAPYVRVAGNKKLTGGGTIIKYDVRFTQPNKQFLPMDVIHSIEHSLATALREHTDYVIDISPMGCQTGFYVAVDGDQIDTVGKFTELLTLSIHDVLEYDKTPGATETECGYAANHNIEGAKEALQIFLNKRQEWINVYS